MQATALSTSNENSAFAFSPVAPARREFAVKAVSDGKRVGLSTQYFDGASDLMRELGFTWFGLRRMWVATVSSMKDVLVKLQSKAPLYPGWDFEDVRDKALAAYREPSSDFFTALLDVQLMPLDTGGFACSAEYDVLVLQVLRDLGGRFHKPAKAWEVRATQHEILEQLRLVAGIDPAYVFVHETFVHLEQMSGGGKSEVPISVAGASPVSNGTSGAGEKVLTGSSFLTTFGSPLERMPVDENLLKWFSEKCGLRHYQVDGVRHLASRTSALLGDDCGVGKTRQGIVAARMTAGKGIVLVVCPASLSINWEREVHGVFPTEKVAFIGKHSLAECSKSDWIIVNYERLAGLVKATDIPIECMLVDEAHNLKEFHAGRTRNAFLLAERIPRCFLLTGTPILNREVEMHTLLRLSGHPIGRMSLSDFRKAYSGSSEARAQLAARLPEWMLRRGKDVLKDLGEKVQQVRYIEPTGGLSGYHKILKDPCLQAMPKITKLREHLEMLKIDFIVESIQSLPDQEKVLIFCEYTDTVDLFLKAFKEIGIGAVSVIGSDSTKKRMQAVDALQKDPGTRVFIGTTKAAGVGLTLTRANYVFMASLPWTNALKQQAEDRAYRSGNTRDVFVIIPLIANTLDERVLSLLNSKEVIEDDLVEAVRVEVSD